MNPNFLVAENFHLDIFLQFRWVFGFNAYVSHIFPGL